MATQLREATDLLRQHWSFSGSQQHTHSYHDREDFIERELPKLLGVQAGDDTPVDAEWLYRIGFANPPGHPLIFDRLIKQVEKWGVWLRIEVGTEVMLMQGSLDDSEADGILLPESSVETRSDARRLCRALGVELKEGPKA